MREGGLALFAAVAAIVCCGGTALAAGLVGGVAFAAFGQLTAVTAVGVGLVILFARRLDRRHNDQARSGPTRPADGLTQDQEPPR